MRGNALNCQILNIYLPKMLDLSGSLKNQKIFFILYSE
jgi:hypothetical protein